MNDLDLDIEVMLKEIPSNSSEILQLKLAFIDLVTTIKYRKETVTKENSNA